MFSSLKVKEFRIYWVGMFISLIGTWVQQVAQGWLVFELTNSAFLLGVVGFLGTIPIFLFSLLGGVFADRFSKRKILISTQISFMLLAFLLAILTQLKLITPSQIIFIAVLNGLIMAFDAPSRQSVVAELVGREHLPNAIALNSVAFNSSRIIGPALAGILASAIGLSGCFYLNGISFLAVIIALCLIRVKERLGNHTSKAWGDLKEGIGFALRHRTIFALIIMVGAVSLFGTSYVILMPVFANEILGTGLKGLGLLMSAAGSGALIGALLLARLGDFQKKGQFLLVSSFVFSLSLIIFSLSKAYLLSFFALVIVGGSAVASIAVINTILQTTVEDRFRGRLMSLFMLTFAGFTPFGNLAAGYLAQELGVSFAVAINGIALTLFFVVINLGYPQIRKIK
jgi:MFS family permease